MDQPRDPRRRGGDRRNYRNGCEMTAALPNPWLDAAAPLQSRHEVAPIAAPDCAADRIAANMALIERIENPPPSRFEALSVAMMRELADIVEGIDAQRAVRILERLAS
jgi:hypothetical protein